MLLKAFMQAKQMDVSYWIFYIIHRN